jgi:quercetin dioxygenase-like cupin family protein
MDVPPIEGQVRRVAAEGAQPREFGSVRWLVSAGDPEGAESTLGIARFDPGKGNAEHTHSNAEEIVYVLEGEFEHTLGDQAVRLGPGDVIVVPRHVPHLIRNAGNAPARAIIFFSSPERDFIPTGRL